MKNVIIIPNSLKQLSIAHTEKEDNWNNWIIK